MKTAAAYIRVSTDRQTELSPESQLKEIYRYAKANGYIVPKEYVFRDDGISGTKASKRPQFQNMISLAKQKPAPFEAILCWKFSRFARNQEEAIVYKSMLKKNGVSVISTSEQIDDSPYGSLIERIIEWMDEYYSIRLAGEVKRGMKEKVTRGEPVSIPAFGYSIENKEYIVNPETAPIVREIFEMYLNGTGYRSIATILNNRGIPTTRGGQWENRTVEYILRNPVYIGKIRWNTERRTRRDYNDSGIVIVEGRHKPIIDEATFNRVQELMDEQKAAHTTRSHYVNEEYMLHGLLKCSNCGRTLAMAVKGTSFQCIGYSHGQCNVSHSISVRKINEMVLSTIEEMLESCEFSLNVRQKTCEKSDNTALIKKDEMKLKRIKEAYEDGVYTLEEYKESRKSVEEHLNALRNAENLPKIDESKIRREFVSEKKKLLKQLKSPNVSEAEKNEILRSFVEYIVFDRRKSTIEIFFYV